MSAIVIQIDQIPEHYGICNEYAHRFVPPGRDVLRILKNNICNTLDQVYIYYSLLLQLYRATVAHDEEYIESNERVSKL